FLRRLRAECIDEEQWLQEYCCIPADESSAFLTHDLITACEDPHLKLLSFDELKRSLSAGGRTSLVGEGRGEVALYLGMDVARKNDLCVIDVGEKIGDVLRDR